MTTSKKVDPVAVGVGGCFALLLLALAGSVALFVIWLRPSSSGTSPASGESGEPPPPGRPLAPEPCAGPPGKKAERSEPLRVRDAARREPSELHDRARALALELEPNAQLVGIGAHPIYPRAAGGTFDAAQDSPSFRFEYRCLNSEAPPGQDLHQGLIQVVARGTTLQATRTAGVEAKTLASRGPLPQEAPCSTTAAWATAVASGLPADALATFLYGWAAGSLESAAWLVTVPGRSDLREIDGQTCRLRSNSPLHPHLSDPGATLPPLHAPAL